MVEAKRPTVAPPRTASGDVVTPRWYQTVAVHRVLMAMARGEQRLLLLMATGTGTGTGKTFTTMQIVHKLRAHYELTDPDHNYRVLYLADRHTLVDHPHRKDFTTAFGRDPLWRVAGGANRSREIYFATYQGPRRARRRRRRALSGLPGRLLRPRYRRRVPPRQRR